MALTVNTNVSSLNAQRNLNTSQASLTTSMQRLSSGMRINSAKDDAAGSAISERFTSQIRGNEQAARNANDGISLSQTAEGDLDQISNNLQRMRELAVQSANATNSSSDRAAIDGEVQSLAAEIDRVASNSSFNGTKLLDGSFTAKDFQVGANGTAADKITISSIGNARTSALGQFQGVNQASLGVITGGAAGPLTIAIDSVPPINVITTGVGADAKSISAAINNSGVQGLTATAGVTTATGTQVLAAALSGTSSFTLNGAVINVTTTTSLASNVANSLAAINAQSAATGVTASDTGAGLKLTAADGRNIDVSGFAAGGTGSALADFGLGGAGIGTGATATTGLVSVTYVKPSGATGATLTITSAASGADALVISTQGTALSATNVLTATGAQNALATIDAAISSVNTSRASLGAYQNRFETTIAGLQTTTENLTASRGRIKDADFAKETASLSRAQVLQQAGTAMLAQANQSAQGVLSLLR